MSANNHLLYRGYVMDKGTGLYYLQSRYYDPNVGRFINADGLVSTGCGILGHNMFAYCNNIPVTNKDFSGRAPWPCTVIIEDGPGLNYMKEFEDIGVIYIPDDSGNGGEIKNSHCVTDVTEMTKYATYLANKSQHKDTVSGSVEGIVFAWWIHNVTYSIGSEHGLESMVNQSRDVNIGRTIYHDNHSGFSRIMWALYRIAWSEQAKSDKAIYKEQE